MFNHKIRSLCLSAGLVVAMAASASAADLTGAGSSFIAPVMSKWAENYKAATSNAVNYQSVGSGAGIKQLVDKTIVFAASDKPMSDADLEKNGVAQFPMISGGIVVSYNIAGVKPGELVLDGKTLADIFLGKIAKWDDAAIKALNPDLKLPSTAISVVYRADSSGTTFNFTDYLSKVSPEWKEKAGSNTTVEWPVGFGAKGSEGVSTTVNQTAGSISYVEYSYVVANHIGFAKMKNAAGKVIEPSLNTFEAAASSADWAHAKNFNLIITNQPGEKSWPIAASTWVMLYKKPADAAANDEALKFFKWAYEKGQKEATGLSYLPVPEAVVKVVEESWKKDFGTK
ncbi:phosphate ABC transporter substrate-binding protein PstS [Rhizobium sp. 2YAF20]|uniref:phosphate ABC transporter substrate-binding protein PstS n=1 Tax=Rhizobium sp. 2YAF20 TaxID=3233027 RepID=UPI003F99AE18